MTDDPVRIFRAARFAASLPDFSASPELIQAMRQASPLTQSALAERVGAELSKALDAPAPGRFLQLLHESGNLDPWFSELAQAADIPAGPPAFHQQSVLDHTAAAMNRAAGDPLTVWMAMVHDLGKTATPADILPHHYNHEQRGQELVRRLVARLKLSNFHLKAGLAACRWHMQAGNYLHLRPGSRVDMLIPLHACGLVEAMGRLVIADRGERDAEDPLPAMQQDLERILRVILPEAARNKGKESGQRLRELRCQALSHVRRLRDNKPDA